MPDYHIKVNIPPVQARPTVITVVCGETETDMRQVLQHTQFNNRYAVIGEWLPSQEWRAPTMNKDQGYSAPPSLPYDQMLALVKEQVRTAETQRLIREHISAIEALPAE